MAWILLLFGMSVTGAIVMTVGYIYGIHRTDLMIVTFLMGCGLQLALLIFWYVLHINAEEKKAVEKFLEPREPVAALPPIDTVSVPASSNQAQPSRLAAPESTPRYFAESDEHAP